MQIRIKDDTVEIEGYVNAVERNSKPLLSRIGQFIERICKGAFFNALKRNEDVHILLNHDWSRDLGSTSEGNLELTEDSIGLYARAIITDSEVAEKGRNGDLVGWSFGFFDVPDGVEEGFDEETKLPLRKVRDLDLKEVSILDRTKTPAYDGTLIMARDNETMFVSEMMEDTVEVTEETRESEQPEAVEIDYSIYEDMIKKMKEEE